MSTLILTTAFLLLSILCLVLLWVALRVARGILRLFLPSGVPGLTTRGIVVALGVTAVLFSDTANLIVRGPLSLALDAFVLFSRGVGEVAGALADQNGSTDAGELLLQEARDFAPELAARARTLLFQFSFPSLAAASAVFLLLASAISGAGTGVGDSSLLLRLRDSWASLDSASRARWGLSASLLTGAYLSLAAIVSLPWLQVPDAGDPRDETEFRLMLSDAARTEREFQEQWSEALIPFDPLESLAPTESLGNLEEETRTALNSAVQSVRQAVEGRNGAWLGLKERASEERADRFDQALNTYRRHTAPDSATQLSEREREILRDDLARWYAYAVQSIDDGLRNYRSESRFLAQDWRRWAISTRKRVGGRADGRLPTLRRRTPSARSPASSATSARLPVPERWPGSDSSDSSPSGSWIRGRSPWRSSAGRSGSGWWERSSPGRWWRRRARISKRRAARATSCWWGFPPRRSSSWRRREGWRWRRRGRGRTPTFSSSPVVSARLSATGSGKPREPASCGRWRTSRRPRRSSRPKTSHRHRGRRRCPLSRRRASRSPSRRESGGRRPRKTGRETTTVDGPRVLESPNHVPGLQRGAERSDGGGRLRNECRDRVRQSCFVADGFPFVIARRAMIAIATGPRRRAASTASRSQPTTTR